MKPITLEDLHAALRTLELPPRATLADAEKAFRKAAVRYHPDKNKAPDAEQKFKDANNALELLKRFTNQGGALPLVQPPSPEPTEAPKRRRPRRPTPVGAGDGPTVTPIRNPQEPKTVRVVVQFVPPAETRQRKHPSSGTIEQAPLHKVRSQSIPNAPTFPVNRPPIKRPEPGRAEAPMAGLDPETYHRQLRQRLLDAAEATLEHTKAELETLPPPKPSRRLKRGPSSVYIPPPVIVDNVVVGVNIQTGAQRDVTPANQGPGGRAYGDSGFANMLQQVSSFVMGQNPRPAHPAAGKLYVDAQEIQRCPHGGVMTGTLHHNGVVAMQGRFNVQCCADGTVTVNGFPCQIVLNP